MLIKVFCVVSKLGGGGGGGGGGATGLLNKGGGQQASWFRPLNLEAPKIVRPVWIWSEIGQFGVSETCHRQAKTALYGLLNYS